MPEIYDSDVQIEKYNDPVPGSLKNRISARDLGTKLVRETPQLKKQKRDPERGSAEDDVLSFVYSFFDDLPEEIIASAATVILSIMKDFNLTDDQRKKEVEQILDKPLSGTEFESLRSISTRIISNNSIESPGGDGDDAEEKNDMDTDGDMLYIDEEEEEEDDDDNTTNPVFVSLNDPIRLRDKTLVRPQDIDAHWLKKKLSNISIDLETVIQNLKYVEDDSFENRLNALENLIGLENFGLARVLAKNTSVVLWYTLLALAESGTEREQIIDTINSKGINMEQAAFDAMDQDLPKELDLHSVGRPVNVPLHWNVKLPEGSTKFTTHDYEQYNVPQSNQDLGLNADWKPKQVSDLPEFAQSCFKELSSLNVVQSKVCDIVVNTNNNILLCAPTGAGKTNVAVLALARCVHLNKTKAVYISPLKALVQEQVTTLQARFASTNISVAELSGDQNLGREQLHTVDIIVSTPEKWDIISRKLSNLELIRSVGLVILDEIHLLHDERRGGVIENIVARHKRGIMPPRLVGLSATLPNFRNVAEFLEVPESGLFFFDSRFRPVPLEQQYIGVTPQGPLKQLKAINEVCAQKVSEIAVIDGKQVLVFVHSRKDTENTRQFLTENSNLSLSQIGIHHAGLDRSVRSQTENLFREGDYRVLVCTATLAWGINLPAAAVIIKGTQYYDPGYDGWRQLSPQDVLQMFGRAGRPGFDNRGLGIIITTQKYLAYFASVATLSLPIQSNLIYRLRDSLNAEIVSYGVKNLDDGIEWLQKTFWSVRSQSDPEMYGDNYTLADVIHSAFLTLHRKGACKYDYPNVKPTFQGELASEFYISPDSVSSYIQQLKPWLSDIDLIRVFSRASEFSSISVRRGESGEIRRLAPLVPFPLRDELDSRFAKVCVLLQAYVSRLPLSGLALSTDMIYIAQSASRLFRTFFEAAIALKWSKLARIAHNLFLMVDKRLWVTGQTPFRQFDDCPEELIRQAESSQLPWQRYFDLEINDIGDILRLSNVQLASTAYKYLQLFPRFTMNASCQPLTCDWMLCTIEILPLFQFDATYHQSFERFWLFIEDQNGNLLYHKTLTMRELMGNSFETFDGNNSFKLLAHIKQIASRATSRYTPYLFARILSDRWLHAEYEAPIKLRTLSPPSLMTATSLISNEVRPHSEIMSNDDQPAVSSIATSLKPLLQSDRFAYVGLPPCTEADECLNLTVNHSVSLKQKSLVICPNDSSFSVTESSDVVRVVTVLEAERISRLHSRLIREFGDVETIICRDMHMISARDGDKYELLITRIKSLPNVQKVIGFGYPVISARSIAQWLGAAKSDVVNFGFDVVESYPKVDIVPWRGGIHSIIPALHSVLETVKDAESLLLVAKTHKQCMLLQDELRLQDINDCASLDEHQNDSNRIKVGTFQDIHRVPLSKSSTVIIFGTDPLAPGELLSITGYASSNVIIFSDQPDYFGTCLNEVLPLESNLVQRLANAIIPEICAKGTWNPQDAVDWLSNTFLYRRLRANPGYYGSQNLQDWVSEMIETCFEYLSSVGAVVMDEETLDVEPLALSHIVCHDGVDLEALVSDEDQIPIDHTDSTSTDIDYYIQVLNARINYAVATNHREKLFKTIDMRQATRRSVQVGSSPLFQIPNINSDIVLRCHDVGIKSIQDFIAIEDDDLRTQLLGFNNEDPRMIQVAEFVNQFPIVDIVGAQLNAEKDAVLITIDREMDADDEIADECWYLVLGRTGTSEVLGFKHLSSIDQSELTVSVGLTPNDPPDNTPNTTSITDGEELTVWLMCGNYIDADKEYSIEI